MNNRLVEEVLIELRKDPRTKSKEGVKMSYEDMNNLYYTLRRGIELGAELATSSARRELLELLSNYFTNRSKVPTNPEAINYELQLFITEELKTKEELKK